MTEPAGIEAFYGDAIHQLRWRRKWSVRRLAEESGVSKGSILNYERGRIVPRLKVRRQLARALGVSPARLFRLAAALHGEASTASGSLVAEVAADLAGDFHMATLPLVTQLVAGHASPPPPAVTEEEIRALAPDLRSLGAHDLQELEDKLPSRLRSWAFVKLVGEESARAASVDAGRAGAGELRPPGRGAGHRRRGLVEPGLRLGVPGQRPPRGQRPGRSGGGLRLLGPAPGGPAGRAARASRALAPS
jgi:transcriptional regulator with XRE-family HTH domain